MIRVMVLTGLMILGAWVAKGFCAIDAWHLIHGHETSLPSGSHQIHRAYGAIYAAVGGAINCVFLFSVAVAIQNLRRRWREQDAPPDWRV